MARLILSLLLALPLGAFAQAGLFDGTVTALTTPADDDRLLIGDQSNQTGKCCIITWGNLEAALDLTASQIVTGTFADARISESSVTQHQAALAITESQISDLGAYLLGITAEPLSDLSDVTVTAIAAGELLRWTGAGWANATLAEAGIAATGHSHTESDITDLGAYLTSVDLTTDVTGALPVANGGTGATTAAGARTALDVDQAGTDNSTPVTLAGSLDYLTLSGQEITRGAIDLATDTTGTLGTASGGTGQASLGAVDAADLGSGAATDGHVLTADGLGGAAWEAVAGGGSGDFLADGTVPMTGALDLGSVGQVDTGVADGASAIAYRFLDPGYATTGGKLLVVENNTDQALSLSYAGELRLQNYTQSSQLVLYPDFNGQSYIHSTNASGFLELGTSGAGQGRTIRISATTQYAPKLEALAVPSAGGFTIQPREMINDLHDGSPMYIRGGAANPSNTTNIDGGGLFLIGGAGASASAADADGGNVTISGGTGYGTGSDGLIIMPNLPTSDPSVSGALWYDSTCDGGSGCVRISP